jgi:DNA-binding NarL/FixJ family response regulator
MRQVGWSQTLRHATEPSGAANPAAADPVGADREAAGITVLIADDHGGFRRALETALRRAPGLKLVGSAHDGNEAVLMSAKLRPRVVVMDLAMPGMSGVEATRRLMEEREPPAVVALSGSRELMRDAIAAGASSTLLKEADLSELLDSIRIVAKR